MKILFVTDGLFPFQIGGMQKHSSVLIRELADLNVQLTVVHPAGSGCSEEELVKQFPNNSNIRFVPVSFTDAGRLPGHYIRANKHYSARIFETVKGRLSEFDLIYAQGFTGRAFIEARKRKELSAPVVVNLHGFEMYQYAPDLKHKIAYHWLKKEASFSLLNADYVYSFGALLTNLLTNLGVQKERILEQSNGIEVSWLRDAPAAVDDRPRTFIFIGRNERRKGIKELATSIEHLIHDGLHFNVHFIGDIPAHEKLLFPNLTYHNTIRDSGLIRSILDQCDCLVVPSYAEGMPTVILEAMSRGLAIIGTNVGAVSRMIDRNGFLLEKPDVALITGAMKQVIQMSPVELDEMKNQSLQLVREKFLWSAIAASKLNDFKKITGKV